MKHVIVDCEGDSLFPTKFYVVSYIEDGNTTSLTTYEEMRAFLTREDITIVGHNFILWDAPQLERILGIKISAKIVDTLGLSWYLYPNRQRHGLEVWGDELGVEKPEIKNWTDLSLEEYVHRCEEDCKITLLLWEKQLRFLSRLYDTTSPETLPIISYLMFKLDCAREQERSRWKLDVEWCTKALEAVEAEQEPRLEALRRVMPPVVKWTTKERPAKPYKKDGTWSTHGAKWFALLKQEGLPFDYKGQVQVKDREEPPNPNSTDQVKDWLFSLGWEPETFKFVKEDDGTERKIPQIKQLDKPELCPSVLALTEEHPEVGELEGLSVVKHRAGLLKGFLRDVDKDGYLKARVAGFTNTLRFKHTEIVNLPGVEKPWGKEIRGCLVAREGYELVGTDMVSLEDTTKKHYMYPYDPDYVNEMSQKNFDPHLDLCKRAKAVSEEDVTLYLENKDNPDLGDNLKAVVKEVAGLRKIYKVVNYSSVYGIGPPKLARGLKVSLSKAKALLESYWERNWAVKKVAEDCIVKTVDGQKWLYNPVSRFWYSLRAEKDRFSTLNQGTGVYCFDSWVKECRKERSQLTAQFHDETISEVKKGYAAKLQELQQRAIDRVNDKLKLNVKLAIDSHSGRRYSEIH